MHQLAEILNASLVDLVRQGDSPAALVPLKVLTHYESQYEISCHLPFFDFPNNIAGFAILNIDRAALLQIWSQILQMPAAETSMVREIAMEITNMVVGNASEALSKRDFHVTLALPHIIEVGQQARLATLKRDNFHYFAYARGGLRFNWVVCMYEAISFARDRRN